MKAVIGQFYDNAKRAQERAEELKRMWKGRVSFVVVGNENKGFMVISETAARACGMKVPLTNRRYKKS